MSNRFKEIDIKKRTCYFFDDIINIKSFDPNISRIDDKQYKFFLIFYIGYLAVKNFSYIKISSANPLYIISNKINGYIEESNGNRYLT